MSETKHSTLPWTVEAPDMFGDYNILQPGTTLAVGAIVSNLRPPEEVAANAALLVLATSLHHELVNALERMTNEVSGMWGAYEPLIREQIGNTNYACVNDKIDAARAVLAKAKPNLDEPRG